MSNTKVKVSKICLDVGGKKIELTLKQAQQLKDTLNDTFGEKVTEYIRPYPYWQYNCSGATGSIAYSNTTATGASVTSGYAATDQTVHLAVA